MERKAILSQLREKLDKNMDLFRKNWWQRTPSVLVGIAKEIAATQISYNELYGGSYPEDYMEYLLRFENPLEVVRDQWISEQTVDLSDEMNHALWTLMDKGDAERDYALDPEYKPSSRGDGPPLSQDRGVTMC